MILTFSPALGQTITAKVAPLRVSESESSPHTILFKATFDSPQSYTRAQLDKFRVELWTNIPIHGHKRYTGEWRSVQFTEQNRSQEPAQPFSLLTEADTTREDNTLYLNLRASLHDHIGGKFSYTFRLVHASGHVEWLGQHGNNGSIVVEQGLPGISISKQWTIRDDGKYAYQGPVEGSTVRLDRPENWSAWVWKPSSFPTRVSASKPCDGIAIVLLPRLCTGDALKPSVIVASGLSRLRLTADGDILVDSVGKDSQAILGILEHSRDLLEEAAAISNGTVLTFNTTSAIVATCLTDADFLCHITTLPVAEAAGEQPYIALEKLQLSDRRSLMLFSPTTRKAGIFNESLSNDSRLRFGLSGADIILSPAYSISEDGQTWQVALLTPSKDFTVQVEKHVVSEVPPTPPPSPPAIWSPCVSTSALMLQETIRTPPTQASRSSAHHVGQRSFLIRSLPARLVRAYLHAMLNLMFWFWSVFLRTFTVRIVGERIPQTITRLLNYVLSKLAARDTGGAVQSNRTESTPPRARISPRNARGTSDNPDNHARLSEVDVQAISAPLAQNRPPTLQAPPLARVVLSASLLKDCVPSVIVRCQGPIKGLGAAFDGRSIYNPVVIPLGDDLHLVELAGLQGEGRLDIYFDL